MDIKIAQQVTITELVLENQKLKQERDEAKQDAATYRARIVEVTDGRELAWEQEKIHHDNYITMKKERDEARESLKHITEYGTEEINSAVDLRQKLAQALVDLDNVQDQRDLAMKIIKRLEQERDEAREVLREMWASGDAFLPYIDQETITRWRKVAGWEETK